MTSSESPAGLLRRAAAVLREKRMRATAEPWLPKDKFLVVHAKDEDDELPAPPVARCDYGGNAEWIAMLGPQIAGPLADWLDAAALCAEQTRSRAASTTDTDRAMAVARALLGEQP